MNAQAMLALFLSFLILSCLFCSFLVLSFPASIGGFSGAIKENGVVVVVLLPVLHPAIQKEPRLVQCLKQCLSVPGVSYKHRQFSVGVVREVAIGLIIGSV